MSAMARIWMSYRAKTRPYVLTLLLVLAGLAVGTVGAPPIGTGTASTVQRWGVAASEGASGRIVLVLQAEDCRENLTRLQRWSAVATAQGVEITGLVLGAPADRAISLIQEQSGVPFLLHREEGRPLVRFVRSIGYRSTPLALGFDIEGRLRFAVPVRSLPGPDAAIEMLTSNGEIGP